MDRRAILVAVALAILGTVTAQVPQDCQQQPPRWECRAWMPAWFFNTETGACQRRLCHNMNSNRWATEEECNATCVAGARAAVNQPAEESEEEEEKVEDNVCSLPSVIGPCRARITRYYFDTEKGRCRRFFYGGCGGNANNFGRKSECRRRCGGAKGKGRRPGGGDGIQGPVDQE